VNDSSVDPSTKRPFPRNGISFASKVRIVIKEQILHRHLPQVGRFLSWRASTSSASCWPPWLSERSRTQSAGGEEEDAFSCINASISRHVIMLAISLMVAGGVGAGLASSYWLFLVMMFICGVGQLGTFQVKKSFLKGRILTLCNFLLDLLHFGRGERGQGLSRLLRNRHRILLRVR